MGHTMKTAIAILFLLTSLGSAFAQTISPAGGSGSGTVTSISAGCGTASTGGVPITTTGTLSAVQPVDSEAGANFPIPNSDCGFLVQLNSASAQTPTIGTPGAGQFNTGWFADVCNIGTATQTLTPTASTINGNSTLAIAANTCYHLVSNGSNYFAFFGSVNTLQPPVALALGTITTNVLGLNITGTWNAVGTTFDAPLFMNITNTASATASLLADFQIGGSSYFQFAATNSHIGSSPALYIKTESASYQGIGANSGQGGLLTFGPSSAINAAIVATEGTFGVPAIKVGGGGAFAWVSAGGAQNFSDTGLFRDAAGTVALRNATTAQALRIYNTFTSSTSGEYGVLDWLTTANVLIIGTEKGSGGGVARNMEFVIGGTNVMDYGVTTASNWAITLTTDATLTDRTVCQTVSATNAALHFGSGTAGVCLGTSSLRYKHDVIPLAAGLDAVMRLEPIAYKLNADHGDPDHVLYGFSAEGGITAVPDLVGMDAGGRPNTFDYLGVVPILVRAIQQQQHEIEELRARP